MSETLITDIGCVVTGRLSNPVSDVDSVYVRDSIIKELNTTQTTADTVIDAKQTTVIPGLVDGHVHPVAGEYTSRQDTLGWIGSYLHAGVTSMVSAGEIHHPGRPTDAAGTKSLAILNRKSFDNQRPSGAKVHAGTLILTDDLTVDDIDDVYEKALDE